MTQVQEAFKEKVGEKGMDWLISIIPKEIKTMVFVCNEKNRGKSIRQIAMKCDLKKTRIGEICQKCKDLKI